VTTADFCHMVDVICTEQYGIDDGGDLCHNLIEMGVVDMTAGTYVAAQQVAMRITKA